MPLHLPDQILKILTLPRDELLVGFLQNSDFFLIVILVIDQTRNDLAIVLVIAVEGGD
jgi:hypothetical protein